MGHADDGGGEGVRRWAWNIAAAVSLVLCAGTVVLWVRSYSHLEGISYCFIKLSDNRPGSGVGLVSFESSRGFIVVLATPGYRFDPSPAPGWAAYRGRVHCASGLSWVRLFPRAGAEGTLDGWFSALGGVSVPDVSNLDSALSIFSITLEAIA